MNWNIKRNNNNEITTYTSGDFKIERFIRYLGETKTYSHKACYKDFLISKKYATLKECKEVCENHLRFVLGGNK